MKRPRKPKPNPTTEAALEKMTDEELIPLLEQEFSDADATKQLYQFVFEIVPGWYLISALQLALSHPQLHAHPAAEPVRHIAESIIEQITAGRPAMAEVAKRGWREHLKV